MNAEQIQRASQLVRRRTEEEAIGEAFALLQELIDTPAQAAGASDFREFVKKISEQTPEKPDYWAECGQCSRNISEAEDLLSTAPQAPAMQADMVSADDLAKLLPYGYYMDQPDGGSPTVLEQVARMAEDAARYRWLRFALSDNSKNGKSHHLCSIQRGHPEELDAAIDAARAAQKGASDE